MKNHRLNWASLLGAALILAIFAPQRAAADDDDPPGRVARLNYTKGEVSLEPAGTDDWVSAVVNRPITTGDKLWSDRDARAELHIGSAAIRLKGDTGFSFLNLTDHIVQIRLTAGTLNVRLRRLEENETFEVDTPNLAVSLLRPGNYRIEAGETGDATSVLVRGGEAEVTGGGQAFMVHADQRATFTGSEELTSDVDEIGGYDDFDEWCRDRDRREERALSSRYVSRDVVGYEDLDDYGDWQEHPDYGYVWVPRTVVVGWAPYRFGHWAWIWPWGWTWVDDAPWGFAPFHYGRWVYWGGYWGWVPCPVHVRPVYAPALVVWVGGPRYRFSLSFGSGGVGVVWFPLGPREVYVPPYRVSRTYVTNVNVTNTTINNTYITNAYNNYMTNNVTNIHYVNRTAPSAVTAVTQNVFASAQPVSRNIVKVNQREMATAPLSATAAVAPQQRSVLGAGAQAPSAVRPPVPLQNRAVVAKTPPPPRPIPFAAQQKALEASRGRPLDDEQMKQLRPAGEQQAVRPNIRIAPPARRPVPVETVARPGRPVQPGRPPMMPERGAPPEVGRSATQVPPRKERIREDRPPSMQRPPEQAPPVTPAQPAPAEAARPVPQERPAPQAPPQQERVREERPQPTRPADRPVSPRADRPPVSPQQLDREARERQKFEVEQRRLEQKHQQQQEKLQQRQQQERQKLEQRQQRHKQQERPPKTQEKPEPPSDNKS